MAVMTEAIMRYKYFLLVGLLIAAPLLGYAGSSATIQASASAVDVVRYVVNYESHAADATELLRGDSHEPTRLEKLLFTRDFLAAWYEIKAKEGADPNAASTDNVTNGDSDYIIGDGPEGQGAQSIKFKDMSDKLNGTMVSMTYRTNGTYSTLFFLKQEDGRFKIDDILLEPFVHNNFDPKTLHRPGTSEGVRKDIVNALRNFAASKK